MTLEPIAFLAGLCTGGLLTFFVFAGQAIRSGAKIVEQLSGEHARLQAVQSSGPAPRQDRCQWFERRGKMLALGQAIAIVKRELS